MPIQNRMQVRPGSVVPYDILGLQHRRQQAISQPKEGEMDYIELVNTKDAFDEMLAQLRQAAEGDRTFAELMLHQISTLGRLATIDDLVSALASRGTAMPRHASFYQQANARMKLYADAEERDRRARVRAALDAAPRAIIRDFARAG